MQAGGADGTTYLPLTDHNKTVSLGLERGADF